MSWNIGAGRVCVFWSLSAPNRHFKVLHRYRSSPAPGSTFTDLFGYKVWIFDPLAHSHREDNTHNLYLRKSHTAPMIVTIPSKELCCLTGSVTKLPTDITTCFLLPKNHPTKPEFSVQVQVEPCPNCCWSLIWSNLPEDAIQDTICASFQPH